MSELELALLYMAYIDMTLHLLYPSYAALTN